MSKPRRRQIATREIVRVVRDFGPLSRADIARRLRLSPSMVTRATVNLLHQGILRESGKSKVVRTGHPSILLSFNPRVASILAVDLRLTNAYAGLTDLGGNVLAKGTIPLPADDKAKSLAELFSLLRQLLAISTNYPPLRAIVVGVPSVVEPQTGIVEWAPSLGWSNLPLGDMLKSEFRLPAHIENDVNLAAVGEHWKGNGRDINNMVFVSVGTGVGSGIIINGELYLGSTGAAGEVSYFIADVETLRDQVGHIGVLEKRTAHDGIIHRARLAANRYPTSELSARITRGPDQIDPSDVFDLALKGDPAARVVWNETVDLLAIVICNLSVVLDPQIIVLGGPGNWQWDALAKAIQSRIGSGLLRPVNLCTSALGRDAVIMGGAATALRLAGVLPV